MAESREKGVVPVWDGSARTWRRYTREVAWFVQGTAVHKRRYCASQLLGRLQGPARLLAMSWSRPALDSPSGTKVLLQKLAASPLVRKSLPNAAAICQQYFSFRRAHQESIGNFLVRETLVHEEFTEALIRLHEEKLGISQEHRDFGLPADDTWSDGDWPESPWSWWRGEDDYVDENDEEAPPDPERAPPADDAGPGQGDSGEPGSGPTGGIPATTGSSPSHRGSDRQSRTFVPVREPERPPTGEAIDEMSVADSFIMGVLRGWRLLQAAGLSAEEKRDILSTTRNSLDYEVVAAALQNLWDDQLRGHRHRGQHDLHLAETEANHPELFYQQDDDWWEDDGWWSNDYSGYYMNDFGAYEDDVWWDEWPGEPGVAMTATPADDPEMDEKIKEAQKAEHIAESLAAEANRSWTEAQRATQALRRDRGFGAVNMAKGGNGGGKCFVCGGNHFARECPDRRHPGLGKGKGYGKYHNYVTTAPDMFYTSKGKNKSPFKGKKGMWLDAQAWTKGKSKGKGKSKEPSRAVNAYAADYFVGGLELSDSLELHSANASVDKSHIGMLDCGATASAAPEAVVQGLITAVLAQDKGARIELDQSARPYFRFGNGRWGRALCRTHIRSEVSGECREFALYTLPNPSEYNQSHFEKSSLVPILIGMDFLGASGVGMMIDFTTGLAMRTRDPQPRIFNLEANKKGHFTLDVVQHLTCGHQNLHGQAHVVVKPPHGSDHQQHLSHNMLELGTVWFDMTAGEVESTDADLEVARERMWLLYQHAQRSSSSSALSAQMCGASSALPPTTTSSSRTHGLSLVGEPRDRQGSGGDLDGSAEGQIKAKDQTKIPRPDPVHESGSKGSSCGKEAVAMLRPTHTGSSSSKSSWPVGDLRDMRPSTPVHPAQGESGQLYSSGEPPHRDEDADRASPAAGRDQAHGQGVPPHAREDHGRGSSDEIHSRSQGRPHYDHSGEFGNGDEFSNEHLGRGTDGGDARRRGVDSRLRERSQPIAMKPKYVTKKEAPLFIGKKLMAMAALMTTATSSLLMGLHLEGRDGVWEIACAPHSWLSQASQEHDLKPRRINLHSGYDLYNPSTWNALRELRRKYRPRKIWFSLPCTKWCQWSVVNYNTEEKKIKLETARRRERRLLWSANEFIKETLAEDETTDVYYEWPWPCVGWKQQPLVDLEEHLESQGIPWLSCRVDGCAYGMRNEDNNLFVKKQWKIRTTDEQFHRRFRAKVCPGNHGNHCAIEGRETARSSYYPWRMVQAIARFWKEQLVPERHVQLLHLREDQPALMEEFPVDDIVPECELIEWTEEDTSDSNEALTITNEEIADELVISAAERLAHESMARDARIRQDFHQSTLETILSELRQAVCQSRQGSRRWVGRHHAVRLLLGGYSYGAFCGISRDTEKHEELVRYVNAYLRHRLPGRSWTGLFVNLNGGSLLHKDNNNMTGSTNYIHGVGDYQQGGLWIHGEPPPGVAIARRQQEDGTFLRGYVLPTRGKIVAFDPKTKHGTQAWTGLRMVISAFTTRSVSDMSVGQRQRLRELGFPLETSNEQSSVPATGELLAVPSTTTSTTTTEMDVQEKEKERWRAQVAKLHKAAGHPTNRNLAKIVRDAGHPEWKVEIALHHPCPACQSLKQGGTSSGQIPPAATHTSYAAWEAVGADTGEWIPPGSKQKVKFVLFMDMATKLRVVQPLYVYDFLQMRTETADDVLKAFTERWLGNFPKPRVLIMDAAKTFASDTVHDFAHNLNIMVSYVAEKEAWSHGIVEAGVQDLKMTASAIHMEALDQDPFITLYLATSALNSTEYTAGYSSFQWAYGREYSLSDEDIRTFSLSDYKGEFARLVTAREQAEAVARRTRARRVLSRLNNTSVRQPLRSFAPMDLVKVWRRVWPKEQYQGPRGGLKKSGKPHWIGPGRVVFNEVLPHQEADDERRHIVWVLIGAQLFRCSAHSVRPATTTEKFTFETSGEEDPTKWRSLADMLPQREFQDLTDQIPDMDEVEEPNLPLAPDATTTTSPTTRLLRKTAPQSAGVDVGHHFGRTLGQKGATSSTEATTAAAPRVTPATTPAEGEGRATPDQEVIGGEPSNGNDAATRPLPVDDVNDYQSPEPKRQRVADDWVQDLYATAAMEAKGLDVFTAFQEAHEFLKVEMELEPFTSNRQQKAFERNPVAYLVKKMKDAEVSVAKLPGHEKVLFDRAKVKEVDSFLKNEAVRKCLGDAEVKRAYDSKRIVRARWVLTWKLTPTEDMEEARQDQATNPNTVYNRDCTKKAKARIVLLGFEHPNLLDPNFKTASPVQSTVGRNLLYALAAQHGWELEGLDLATAFLQTQATEADQELWTSGVRELREALNIGEEGIMRVLRNIYGSTTAPRGLWLDLRKTLTKLGGQAILGERCLWIFLSRQVMDGNHPKLLGAMGGHVDDFHRVGDGSPEWMEIREKINKAYKWGMTKTKNYRHAGTDVITTKDELGAMKIVVNQDYYAEGLADVEIDMNRLRSEEPLTHRDVEACRASLGALQWLAIQSQPQISARCNLLLTDLVTVGTMSVAREIQEVIAEVRREPFSLVFQKFHRAKHWSEVVVITMGDQAHANRPKGDSTGGLVTLLAGPESLSGEVCPMSLITWRTWKLKRKAIGSNDAEVQAMLEAEDQNFRTRLLWAELHGAGGHAVDRPLRGDRVEMEEKLAIR